jgi:hypothetical protein
VSSSIDFSLSNLSVFKKTNLLQVIEPGGRGLTKSAFDGRYAKNMLGKIEMRLVLSRILGLFWRHWWRNFESHLVEGGPGFRSWSLESSME